MDFFKLAWFRIQVRIGITTSEARALLGVASLLLVGVMIEQVRLHLEGRRLLVVERAPVGTSLPTSLTEGAVEMSEELQVQRSDDSSIVGSARAGPIDINNATAAELDILPGIGPALAERIVDYRERYGRFADVESLVMVRGIGPRTMEELRDLVAVAD